MEHKNNKEKWVEEILESAEKINRIEASPYIYPKILNRLKDQNKTGSVIPYRRAAMGFITVILLAVINLLVIFGSAENTVSDKNYETKKESSSQFIPSQYNPYLEILTNN